MVKVEVVESHGSRQRVPDRELWRGLAVDFNAALRVFKFPPGASYVFLLVFPFAIISGSCRVEVRRVTTVERGHHT